MAVKKGCFWPNCPEIVEGASNAFCEKHRKRKQKTFAQRVREVSQREQKFYNCTLWTNTSRGFRARHPNCRECAKRGIDTFGQEVDHIIPLKMAWHLRLEPRNMQTLCKSCHGIKRSIEAKMYSSQDEAGKCIIVSGPPACGKSTFVKNRYKKGDLILDLDILYSAISLQPLHVRPNEKVLIGYALAAREAIIEKAILDGGNRPNFWFIIGAPDPIERKRFQELFKADVYVLAIPKEVCLKRLADRRDGRYERMKEVTADWWHQYEPRYETETTLTEND